MFNKYFCIGAIVGSLVTAGVMHYNKKKIKIKEKEIVIVDEEMIEEINQDINIEQPQVDITQENIEDTDMEKEEKDYTLDELQIRYELENRVDDIERINNIRSFLIDDNNIEEKTIQNKSLEDISFDITKLNDEIKAKYNTRLKMLNRVLSTKPNKRLTFMVTLPEDITLEPLEHNVAFTRTYFLRHINEAVKRINAITKKFTIAARKTPKDDYVTLNELLITMNRDLNLLDTIIPAIDNKHPSVNSISMDNYGQHKKMYLNYLKQKWGEEKYLFNFTKNYYLEFQKYKV